ncbi:CobQ/CobB/MinD/ParA nucleotide binding domain protein [Acididesulfobacillus acetoxydans]|uniref:CobQ/CobB/MinD/ParA nucleotide binding domain protein n=1 Tax=Acididesulfobacillus acetoxydans TaxID=1561005 RepID=A0A8S0W5M2_9FIRM|nr:ATP-binding protein [Acididesulfobacillus acetoxydans]CAA7603298.1 CobQ/CobB/MinD/ParA nucleotide binding domain protein [Acididesulfobacillus acetoxydans]
MKIAVLSGKGGTGKTTVATSLAQSLPECQYIDCDVEEPNGAIFLNPDLSQKFPVQVLVPQVDDNKCNKCGECAKACQFHAIAVVKNKVLVFPEICHHCGACIIACPREAVSETKRTIGFVETSRRGHFLQGKLNIGEPISVPIIQDLKRRMHEGIPVILDCSPGASCTVVQSIEGCDYCILVTEPTPFGLHDLKIAVQVVKKMGIPFGVVINKATSDNTSIQDCCRESQIEVLLEIPFSKEIAEGYSRGLLPVQNELWKDKFRKLYKEVKKVQA